ncbi:MAG: hypothetical protein E6J90_32625 [Deltaproteobacteria bacterium]|nr:MAG: hypothetical protein E6J90_32625 [Deltaproteobacteria bacterium]
MPAGPTQNVRSGARREDDVAEHGADRRGGRGIALEQLDGADHVVGRQRLAGQGEVVELLDRRAGGPGGGLVTLDGDLVAAEVDLSAGGALDELQPGIVAAAQRLQRLWIIE